MQTGTFKNTENYLAANAKQTHDVLLIANPHKQAQQGQEVHLDHLMTAIFSG